jgi:hypothetical protein
VGGNGNPDCMAFAAWRYTITSWGLQSIHFILNKFRDIFSLLFVQLVRIWKPCNIA